MLCTNFSWLKFKVIQLMLAWKSAKWPSRPWTTLIQKWMDFNWNLSWKHHYYNWKVSLCCNNSFRWFPFQSFHKKCFTCFDCKKPLDSTSCNDAPNGEIFCKSCYGKNFGPKGYGYGGSNVPAMMAGEPGQFADDRVQ